ncbi:DUF2336 domain-containing protein [Woodsholea maritima]|uniref:DUF2336 domain-containing protein n=1 Tax=Woodsholea maritima TaxID=240237 RepID=UPI001F33010F|nr:DUF2336 domain-containing protein [Woodsholea maritima]
MADLYEFSSDERLMGEPVRQGPTARTLLARRLADIVCLPSSRVTPPERWVVADVLDEVLRQSDESLRRKVADRLAEQKAAPLRLLRRLACDVFEVAEPILERSLSLTDFDMMEVARTGEVRHRLSLARRLKVTQPVSAALVLAGEPQVLEALLRNTGAQLAAQTMDHLVQMVMEHHVLAHLLIQRPEMRPNQAFSLFWDCDHELRRMILDRFAVGREILQDAAEDVFPRAAREPFPDPLIQRALAYIDRRQRDRQASSLSPWGSLEGVIEAAERQGLEEMLCEEAAKLANIQRSLFDRMCEDFGGEPLAVLCKATGLSRDHLVLLLRAAWKGLREDQMHFAIRVYDTLSVDKAQTVLRYWDWSLSRPNSV